MLNPQETTLFFNDLLKYSLNKFRKKKEIFIDVSRVEELTIDALMYLLAVLNNLRYSLRKNIVFSGNAPADTSLKRRFTESGFYQYVEYTGIDPISKNENNIQIVSGNNSNTMLAKSISDFVCRKANLPKRKCGFLYNMMIELMSNTHKHAYNNNNTLFNSRWYCFAEYDEKDTIYFTFLDTGEGIPATVRKNFREKLDILGIKDENKYVISALNGEFRTATRKEFRGKGLPTVKDFCFNNIIQSMRIITNKADVKVSHDSFEAYDMRCPLRGTLYYWQISISNLRGD